MAVPCTRFALECRQIRDAAPAETLSRDQSDFDLRLVEPASVCGHVVHGETVPDFIADLLTEQVCERFAAMDVEIVDNRVNGSDGRVLEGQMDRNLDKLRRRAVGVARQDAPRRAA